MAAAVAASVYPQLRTQAGVRVGVIQLAQDAKIVEEMITADQGQEILDFTVPFKDNVGALVQNEMQIYFGGSAFRVKTLDEGRDADGDKTRLVHCEAKFYDLGDATAILVPSTTSAATAIATALAGTGWTAGTVTPPASGTFSVDTRATPLAILRALPGTFGGELVFDNVAQTVSLIPIRGNQAGTATFGYARNVTTQRRVTDTTELLTRVRPIGANDVDISTVNGGVPYLDDFTWYTSQGNPPQIKDAPVENSNITDPVALKAWGLAQLAALSRPRITYTTQPATINGNPPQYDPGLGDKVRVWDPELKLNVFTRISQRVRLPLTPWNSTLQLNTTLYTVNQVLDGVVQKPGTTAGTQAGILPSAPTALTLTSAQGVDADGHTYTYATIGWGAVVTNIDGTPIVNLAGYYVEYQVDGGAWTPLGQTTRTAVQTPPFRAQAALAVRVQSINTAGGRSGFTTMSAAAVKDTNPPGTPSTPVLSSKLPLAIEVSWNGLDAAGLPMPADFSRVEVHLGSGPSFVPTTKTVNLLTGDASTFEASTGGWALLAGGGAGTLTRTTSIKRSGVASLQTQITVATPSAPNTISPLLGQTVNPGDQITVQAWIYAPVSASYTAGARWYDKDGNIIGEDGTTTSPTTVPANTWTQVAGVLTVPAGGAGIATKFGPLGGQSAGTVWYTDDVTAIDPSPTLFDSINNPAGGIAVATRLVNGAIYYIGLRAVDLSGNTSAMTTPVAATASLIPAGSHAALSITDADIGSINAGKIVTGVLIADLTVSSRIKTADTGARVELNSSGLKAYNTLGVNTVSIGSDGAAKFIGAITGSTVNGSIITTALSGNRVEMNGVSSADRINYWAGTGSAGEQPMIMYAYYDSSVDQYSSYIRSAVDVNRSSGSYIQLRSGNGGGGPALLVLQANANNNGAMGAGQIWLNGKVARGSGAYFGTNYTSLQRVATLGIGAGAWVDFLWQSILNQGVSDDGDLSTLVATPGVSSARLISRVAGLYMGKAAVSWAASSSGGRMIQWITQGGTVVGGPSYQDFASQTVTTTTEANMLEYLPGGGYYVKAQVYSSVATTTAGNAVGTPTRCSFGQLL